jgi:hypothetical protein
MAEFVAEDETWKIKSLSLFTYVFCISFYNELVYAISAWTCMTNMGVWD